MVDSVFSTGFLKIIALVMGSLFQNLDLVVGLPSGLSQAHVYQVPYRSYPPRILHENKCGSAFARLCYLCNLFMLGRCHKVWSRGGGNRVTKTIGWKTLGYQTPSSDKHVP